MVAVVLALVLVASGPAAREKYRVRDLRWVRARPHELQPVEVETSAGRRHLVVLAPHSSVARLSCPPEVRPRRYLVGPAAVVEGPFSEPVATRRFGDRVLWFFAEDRRGGGVWAFAGNGCDIDVRIERWRGRGLDRLDWGEEQPAAYALRHRLLTSEQEHWLRRDAALGALRFEVLRPLFTIPGASAVRPDAPAEESLLTDGEQEQVGFVGERPAWHLEGPARIDIVARPLGDASAVCLIVDGEHSCRSNRPEPILPWRPGLGLAAARVGARAMGSALVWRAAVGNGQHRVEIDSAAWVRLVRLDAVSAVGLARPLVYPDDCQDRACAEQQHSVAIPPDPLGPPAQATALWRPGTSPSEPKWVPLAEAEQRPPSVWLDEHKTLDLRVAAPADSCQLRFATGQVFVAPAGTERGRFAFAGRGDPRLPVAVGCSVLAQVEPTQSDTVGLVRSVFQLLRPGMVLPYRVDGDGETSLRVSMAAGGRDTELTVETNRGTEVFTIRRLPAVQRWRDDRGRAWDPVVSVELGSLQWIRVHATETVALQVRYRPPSWAPRDDTEPGSVADEPAEGRATPANLATGDPRPASAGLLLDPRKDLTSLSTLIAAATDDVERGSGFCRRAATLEAIGADALAASDRRLAVAVGGTPCVDEPDAPRLPPDSASGGWVALDSRWLPEGEAAPRLLSAAARGDLAALATRHAIRRAQPAPGSPAAWSQLERWRHAILGGQILTADQGVLAYLDLVRLASREMHDSLTYYSLKRASRWQPVQGFSGDAQSVLVSTATDDGQYVAGSLFPEPWPRAEVVFVGRRALALPAAYRADETVGARCRATSPRTLHDPITLSVFDAHQQPIRQVLLWPFGEATLVPLPNGGKVYLETSPTSGVSCQLRLPRATVAALRDRDQRRGFRVQAGKQADVEVLAPTVLRLAISEGTFPDAIEVELETVSTGRRTPGRAQVIDGEMQIPVAGVGPHRVWIRPSDDLVFAASIRVPRHSPLESRQDRILLASLTVDPSSDTEAAVDLPQPFFGGREEKTLPATATAHVHVGSDDTLLEDDAPTVLRMREGVGVTQRLVPGYLWWDAELQFREQTDAPLVTVGSAGIDGWILREPLHLRVVLDANVAHGDGETSGRLSSYLQVGTVSQSPWEGFVRIRGLAQKWWPRQLFGPYPSDPALWSRFRDDHPRSVAIDPAVRWRPSRWHRLTASGSVRTNAARDDDLLDHVAVSIASDNSGPGWQVRLAATLERRFADEHRANPYWGPELSGRYTYTWWPWGRLGVQLRLGISYRAHFGTVLGGVAVRVFASDDHGLEDLRPSRIAHRAAAEWSQDASMERDWPR